MAAAIHAVPLPVPLCSDRAELQVSMWFESHWWLTHRHT